MFAGRALGLEEFFFKYSKISALDGCGLEFHSARIALHACAAVRESGAVTPTKSPSRTTFTPSMASADFVSMDCKVASYAVGRRILPKTIPGNFTSDEYF